MASAYDVIRNQNSGEPVSFEDFYNARGAHNASLKGDTWIKANPYGFLGKLNNFFTGQVSTAEQDYNNYLTKLSTAKTYEREDSAVQRAVKDIEAAGLNPWLALNGGSFSGTSSSAHSGYKEISSKKDGTNLLSSALKLLILLALKG